MESAARRAEAYQQIKYAWRVQQAVGGASERAIFEGAPASQPRHWLCVSRTTGRLVTIGSPYKWHFNYFEEK